MGKKEEREKFIQEMNSYNTTEELNYNTIIDGGIEGGTIIHRGRNKRHDPENARETMELDMLRREFIRICEGHHKSDEEKDRGR